MRNSQEEIICEDLSPLRFQFLFPISTLPKHLMAQNRDWQPVVCVSNLANFLFFGKKVLLEQSDSQSHGTYCRFCTEMHSKQLVQRPHGPEGPHYLLSGSLCKKLSDSWLRSSHV